MGHRQMQEHRGLQQTVDYNFFTHFVYIYNPIFGANLHLQRMMKIYNLQQKIAKFYNFQNKQIEAFCELYTHKTVNNAR